MPVPDFRLAIYCSDLSHAKDDVGPFLLRGQTPWQAEKTIAAADGVFAVAVMELNRSHDQILTVAMERGPDTFGLWTIATDVPAPGRLSMHRPRSQCAEMLTIPGEGQHGRVRIRLRCGWCGLSYERRMPEFCAQLDALAVNGITAISLRSLIDTR